MKMNEPISPDPGVAVGPPGPEGGLSAGPSRRGGVGPSTGLATLESILEGGSLEEVERALALLRRRVAAGDMCACRELERLAVREVMGAFTRTMRVVQELFVVRGSFTERHGGTAHGGTHRTQVHRRS